MIDERREGYTEVIVGGMFSGKTGELILCLEKFERGYNAKTSRINGGNGEKCEGVTLFFRPATDNRGAQTHCGRYQYDPVSIDPKEPWEILDYINFDLCQAIGIDEAQWFDDAEGLVNLCLHLNSKGVCVIIAGLDLTWELRPFGAIPTLMAYFHVRKVYSVCWKCGYRYARFSERLADDQRELLVTEADDDDTYKPCCQSCHPYAKKRSAQSQEEYSQNIMVSGKQSACS